jgi:hypothetical protein
MSRSIIFSRAAAFAAVFGLYFTIGAVAHAAPKLINITLSKTEMGDNTDTFEPSVAKLFLNFKLEDVPPGTKLTCKWIAVDTKGIAPPNSFIDGGDLITQPRQVGAVFSLTKPTNGFPIGSYRVDIFVGGKLAQSVNFKVEPISPPTSPVPRDIRELMKRSPI